MAEPTIENLEELIQQHTGPQCSVVEQEISYLTAPGENYLSTLLKVDLIVKNNDTGKSEEIHAVAKCAFGTSDAIIHIPGTFRNEINFYGKIVPFLLEFQEAHGVENILDIFPKMYAARLNLEGGPDKAEHNAVLLLENLRIHGYSNVDRHEGFDSEGAKLILKDLAAFHAVPLAVKLKNPKLFEEEVQIFCKRPEFGIAAEDMAKMEPPETIWLEVLEDYESCRQYLPSLKQLLKMDMEKFLNRPVQEPFGTLVHNDLWVNNTMQTQKNGRLIDNKFVDFQIYFYGSPADDLMFFLFSSVNLQTLKDHFDELLKFYHNHFRHVLERFGCNVVPFNYSKFIEEVKSSLQLQLSHMMIMNFVIFGEKGVALEPGHQFKKMKKENIPPVARDRFLFIVEELGRRGWI